MKKLTATVISLMPVAALAQTAYVTDVNTLTAKLVGIGNIVLYLLIALAVIFIVWNVVMALIKGESPDEKSKALKNVGYGILGLAIIVSVWGLVQILTGTCRTQPTNQAIPNLGNNVGTGGIPANQIPRVD